MKFLFKTKVGKKKISFPNLKFPTILVDEKYTAVCNREETMDATKDPVFRTIDGVIEKLQDLKFELMKRRT